MIQKVWHGKSITYSVCPHCVEHIWTCERYFHRFHKIHQDSSPVCLDFTLFAMCVHTQSNQSYYQAWVKGPCKAQQWGLAMFLHHVCHHDKLITHRRPLQGWHAYVYGGRDIVKHLQTEWERMLNNKKCTYVPLGSWNFLWALYCHLLSRWSFFLTSSTPCRD